MVLAGFLARRFGDLLAGKGTAFDTFALILFVCLSLAPIFAEISLLGVRLKQKIDALDNKVEAVKAELHNTLSIQSHFNPSISIVAPPDYRLPELEAQIKKTLDRELERTGNQTPDLSSLKKHVPSENVEMFEVRFNLESELARIWRERFDLPADWPSNPLNANSAVKRLVEEQLISPELGRAIREVYAVCSSAIHGREATEAQIKFVRDVAPRLLRALRAV